MTNALVENTTIEDAFNTGFYHTNYNTPVSPDSQSIVFRNDQARRVGGTAVGRGYALGYNSPYTLGEVIFDNARGTRTRRKRRKCDRRHRCFGRSDTPSADTGASPTQAPDGRGPAATAYPTGAYIKPVGPTVVDIDGWNGTISGTRQGSGNFLSGMLYLVGRDTIYDIRT